MIVRVPVYNGRHLIGHGTNTRRESIISNLGWVDKVGSCDEGAKCIFRAFGPSWSLLRLSCSLCQCDRAQVEHVTNNSPLFGVGEVVWSSKSNARGYCGGMG